MTLINGKCVCMYMYICALVCMRDEEKCIKDELSDKPNTVQDEEQLDENAAKGQNAAHKNARQPLGVALLWWHLPGNLVCSDWLFLLRKGCIGERQQAN